MANHPRTRPLKLAAAVPDGAKLVPVPPAYAHYRPGSFPRPYGQPVR